MKKILLLLLAIFSFGFKSQAQYVTINDTNLVRVWTQDLVVSQCMVGNQLDTICAGNFPYSTMTIFDQGIVSINGLQYFKPLRYVSLTMGQNFVSIDGFPPNLDSMIFFRQYPTLAPNVSSPAIPTSIRKVTLGGLGQLTNLNILNDSVENLAIFNMSVQTINPFPSQLQELKLNQLNGFAELNNLNTLAPKLKKLDCTESQVGSFTTIPDSLEYLSLKSSDANQLGPLPLSLRYLDVRFSQVLSLPSLPTSLRELYTTDLNQLPLFPDSIEILETKCVSVTVLDSLPKKLTSLHLNTPNLTSLPALPQNLEYLTLTAAINLLSNLPIHLKEIYIVGGPTNLVVNSFPDSLIIFAAMNCGIISLPHIPDQLMDLAVPSNNITSLDWNPADSIYRLDVYNNSNFSCLPSIKKTTVLNFVGTNVQCIPNPIRIYNMGWPDVDTFLLCNPGSGCEFNWRIKGSVYLDMNSNCVRDGAEDSLNHVPIKLISNGNVIQITQTNNIGEYAFVAPYGNYEVMIDTTGLHSHVSCPSTFSQSVLLTSIDSTEENVNFFLECPPSFDLKVKSADIIGRARPGAIIAFKGGVTDNMNEFNARCYTGSATVTATLSGPIHSIAVPLNDFNPVIIGNVVQWTVTDFSLVNIQNHFSINAIVDTTAQIGDSVGIVFTVTAIGEADTSNNEDDYVIPVVTSYDPNDKSVSKINQVYDDYDLEYVIRFQNTGTIDAINIRIEDTLSANVDFSTFQLISSSHEVLPVITADRVVNFYFNNIHLIDSTTNEPLSHGYVKYRIKRIASTTIGAMIDNTAYIYFDYNSPVVTNTVTTIVVQTIGVNELAKNRLIVYPNPTNGKIKVDLKQLHCKLVQLIDVTGKVVYEKVGEQKNQLEVDLSGLATGCYHLLVVTNNEVVNSTVVKN